MHVFKTTHTITVFAEFYTQAEAENVMNNIDTEKVLEQITDGNWIGSTSVGDIVEVPPEKVQEEMLAIGNDGKFFEMGDQEDDEGEGEDAGEFPREAGKG